MCPALYIQKTYLSGQCTIISCSEPIFSLVFHSSKDNIPWVVLIETHFREDYVVHRLVYLLKFYLGKLCDRNTVSYYRNQYFCIRRSMSYLDKGLDCILPASFFPACAQTQLRRYRLEDSLLPASAPYGWLLSQ